VLRLTTHEVTSECIIMNDSATISIVSDAGVGRTTVIIAESGRYANLASAVAAALGGQRRILALNCSSISVHNYDELTSKVLDTLSNCGVRQAQFVGLGSASALVQNVALQSPKMVRSMVVVDASMRPHPTRAERVLDTIERGLPFGLPLRLTPLGFNVRAFAHRLRCPILLVASDRSSVFIRRELRELSYKAPTAWYMDISNTKDQVGEIVSLIGAFQEIPAKSPQKNLQVAL